MKAVKFNAVNHVGHEVYGVEKVEFIGELLYTGKSWYLGRNKSDDEAASYELVGCSTCCVEFERTQT